MLPLPASSPSPSPAGTPRRDLQALREMLRAVEGRAAPAGRAAVRRTPTGLPALDRLLPWRGYPPGELTQVVAGEGEGALSLVARALVEVTGRGRLAAVIDGEGTLYPPALAALGVDLHQVLIVRPSREASRSPDWAVAEAAKSGAFPLVVASAVPFDAVACRRLGRAAEAAECAILVLSRPPVTSGLPVALRLALRPVEPGGRGRSRPVRVVVERVRGAAPGTSVVVDLAPERTP